MLFRCSRMAATAVLAVLPALVLLPALPVLQPAPAAAAPTAQLASTDTPTITGTLTDLLTGLLAALLGGQTTVPAPPPAPGQPAPAPIPMAVHPSFEDRVVAIVNRRRAAAGCPAVRSHAKLRRAARTHSVGMAQYRTMTHFLPGEAGLGERVSYAGYDGWRRLAENVASGFDSPRGVMQGWMRSPSHRRNILDCRMRHLGVGVVVQGSQLWWTQDFGRR
ncbi:CAP domain-containing protein [Nocardioides sp. R1-1]|uniref:CAP domain-containing protein n=1 Tax=Nocardioides sp. R1-1 TaxID=3383502 RepID=UPI0038D0F790